MNHHSVDAVRLSERPQISVIVPHFSSSREENLRGLIEDLRGQSFRELEIFIVRGVSPQGKAINEGARLAQGEILAVLDDDSRLGHPRVIENLVRAIRENPRVAMAGASIMTPPHANRFQKKAAKQFPRFNMPLVGELTDSDLPCHGCVAFRREVFVKVGMERDDILRGLDPDLRVRIREAGWRVVLVPDTWAYHPLPESPAKFLRTFFRNGYGAAYLQQVHPEINYDTDEKVETGNFVPKRSFAYRLIRYPFRLAASLAAFQWIRFLGYTAYAVGYAAGFFHFSRLKKGTAVFLILSLIAGGCATGPKSKEPESLKVASAEVAVGEKIRREILSNFYPYTEPKITAYLDRIGHSLAEHAERKDLPYSFTLLYNEKIYAASSPGGFIYLTTGLMVFLENEAELAAVLAHEIGQLQYRDPHLSRSRKVLSAVTEAGTMVAPVLGQIGALAALGLVMMHAAAEAGGMSPAERIHEADRKALHYMVAAGYDPQGMLDLLTRMQKSREDLLPYFYDYDEARPVTEKRLESLEREFLRLPLQGETFSTHYKEYQEITRGIAEIYRH